MLRRGMMAAASVGASTWNPVDKGSSLALSGSDLIVTKSGGGTNYSSVRATHARSATHAGGYYFEVVITSASADPYIVIGVSNSSQVLNNYVGSGVNGWAYYQETGEKYTNAAGAAYGAIYAQGDVIGCLLKNGKVYFRKNGTWQNSADVDAETGAAFSGLTGNLFPTVSLYKPAPTPHALTGRFKASDFTGSIPTGAAAWES